MTDKIEEIEKEKEIVNLFNSLVEAISEDLSEKLEILGDQKYVIFNLVSKSLYSLEECLKDSEDSEDNYDSLLAIDVFKALFLNEYSLKIDALEDKKCCFNYVLKLLLDAKLSPDENKKIIQSIVKYKAFDTMANDFNGNYYYVYCLYLVYEYSDSRLFFLNTFISFIKEMYKNENNVELEIRKDENVSESELGKLNPIVLLDSLKDFYYKNENFYILCINENKLKFEKFSAMELATKLNENPKSAKKSKKKKKKTKKSGKAESNQGENLIPNENLIQNKNPIQNKNNIQKENNNQKENKNIKENIIIKKNKIIKEKKMEIKRVENIMIINKGKRQEDSLKIDTSSNELISKEQYNKLVITINELISKIKDLNEKDALKTAQINNLNKKDELKTAQINNLIEENKNLNKKDELKEAQINNLIEENKNNKAEIKEMKENDKIRKKRMQNIRKNLLKIEKDLIMVKYELDSIKFRDIFRNIIDLFCKAYNISQEFYYADKIIEIKTKISRQPMKEDERNKLFNFFDKIYFDYQYGNKSAHSIDFAKSIIDQVFVFIDPKNELEIVKMKLMKGKLDNLLKKFVFNRLNNYNNKAKLRNEEQGILETVSGISELYPNEKNINN